MGSDAGRTGLSTVALWLWASLAAAQVNVTTYHNDNARSGQNTRETTLTLGNVNDIDFGKLFTVAVDGDVYVQPLYLASVGIAGGTHPVVFVGTEHDSVYALDADTGRVYWRRSLLPPGAGPVSSGADLDCGDIATEVGITGTPVIDAASGTLYVVAKIKWGGAISQRLHALDVSTGADKFGGPRIIATAVEGTAPDGDGSMIPFDSRRENQRAALLLSNGHVVIGWTAHCDKSPWHGWVMSYGATTLTLEGTYNASANGYGAGIWMSGGGIAADDAGNFYFATGNGSGSATDHSDSVLKLGPPSGARLPVLDYFTPYNQGSLANTDGDLSSGGLILLPRLANGRELLTIMGKEGKIYLLDRGNLGKYCVTQTPKCVAGDPQIVQEVAAQFSGFWGTPAYWNGNLYWGGGNADTGEAEPIKAYSFNAGDSGKISMSATSRSARIFNFSGPSPSVSSNGASNGILWGIDNGRVRTSCAPGTNCQTLYAYDAANLNKLLYSSLQAPGQRDLLGRAIKFATPTIANGKVYVPSGGAVSAFGLLTGRAPAAAAPTLTPGGGTYSGAIAVTIADATPNAAIYYSIDGAVPSSDSGKYAGALEITTSTTVMAFAVADGHGSSAVSSATYTVAPAGGPYAGSTPVNQKAADNVHAFAQNGVAAAEGGFDTHGFALSATLLGDNQAWDGMTFDLATAGAAAASGSGIALPAGHYDTLNLLAAAVNHNQPAQKFLVTYADGSSTTFTQSVSDWFTPQNYPGESRAVSMRYVLRPDGTPRFGRYYLYGYRFPLDPAKMPTSVTLPANRNVVVVATTVAGAGMNASAPTTVDLSGANVFALTDNGVAAAHGGLDAHGFAASKTLLGPSRTWSDTTFILGAAGAADAVSSATVPLPHGAYSALKFLAAAVNGNQPAQEFRVTYTDGTATTFIQSVSDWFTPQQYAGESRAVGMNYVLTPTGSQRKGNFSLYGYSLALNAAKAVQSVTLPANRNVVVFAAHLQ